MFRQAAVFSFLGPVRMGLNHGHLDGGVVLSSISVR